MPLRLLEIAVDRSDGSDLNDILAERDVHVHSRIDGPEGGTLVSVVLPAEHTEALTDALTERFGGRGGFRILVLAVEAVLPVAEAEKEVAPEPSGEEQKPPPNRVSREELYEDVSTAAQLTSVYLATVGLSTIVAAAGLIRGDVAVIIGAMVIAPLLGPSVAFGLGLTLGDLSLARVAAKASSAGVALAFGISFLTGLFVPLDPSVPELAGRTQVGLPDVAIAMAAGSAGSLAYTTGLPTAIIGVMVAVALLPPLVAAGLLLGAGYPHLAAGSTVLVLVNFTCVSLAAVATFFIRQVRPRTWWEAEKAKKATRVAVVSWLVLLAVLVGLIYFLDARDGPDSDFVRSPDEEAAAAESGASATN